MPLYSECYLSAENLTEFVATLPARVADSCIDASLIPDLEHYIAVVRQDSGLVQKLGARVLEQHGVALWNLCVRLKHNDGSDSKLECLLRGFALLLLDRHQKVATSTSIRTSRLLQLANGVIYCRLRLDSPLTQTSVCDWVLERAADYEHALSQQEETLEQAELLVFRNLSLEHRLQRVKISWKQDRLDIARSMYAQLSAADGQRDVLAAEQCADLCFEIGSDLLQRKDHYQATQWLESSLKAFTTCRPISPDTYAHELRFCILQHLAHALVILGDEKSIGRSLEVIDVLEQDYAGKIAIPLLKMEVINAQPGFNTIAYSNELQRVISTVAKTETNLKMIVAHALVLKKHDLNLTCLALDELLSILIKSANETDWVERVAVTRIWISLGNMADLMEQTGIQTDIQQMLDQIHSQTQILFTAVASHAIQVLLWKRIEDLIRENKHHDARQWCQLALHVSLSNAGETCIAKLQRKHMLCSIALGDTKDARIQFGQMLSLSRQDPMTQYLMYKVAILDLDLALASNCLETVARSSSQDAAILYACVQQAQSSGNREPAIATIQKVLHSYEHESSSGIHLPALIRCIAKLLIGLLDQEDTSDIVVASELVSALDLMLNTVRKSTTAKETFHREDFEWFIETTFGLIVRYLNKWDPGRIIILLEVCIEFIAQRTSGETSTIFMGQSQFCHVVMSQLLVKAARTESVIADQLQLYRRVHNCAITYWCQVPQVDITESAKQSETGILHGKMLLLHFEACTALREWDHMQNLVARIIHIKDGVGTIDTDVRAILDSFADMVLASDAPGPVMTDTICAIIDCPSAPILPPPRLARWLRVLYQLSLKRPWTLDATSDNPTKAILARACRAIDSVASTQQPYPQEEIEWLATTTFNKAVDAYCESDKTQCQDMGELAFDVAKRVADGGKLGESVKDRLARMVWKE